MVREKEIIVMNTIYGLRRSRFLIKSFVMRTDFARRMGSTKERNNFQFENTMVSHDCSPSKT